MITELTIHNFDIEVEANSATLVEFYTPTCSHCKKLVGALEKISKEFEGSAFIAKCDIEAQESLQGRFDITAVPTLLFFKNGQLVNRLVVEIHPLIIAEEIKKLQK